MNNILFGIIDWIKSDYKTNKFRFCVELVAWGISIGCAITMALTVPTPPLLALYPIWIAGCAMYAWEQPLAHDNRLHWFDSYVNVRKENEKTNSIY